MAVCFLCGITSSHGLHPVHTGIAKCLPTHIAFRRRMAGRDRAFVTYDCPDGNRKMDQAAYSLPGIDFHVGILIMNDYYGSTVPAK